MINCIPYISHLTGDWIAGERTGNGVLTLVNGEKHDGAYLKNKKEGPGWWRFFTGASQ